MLHKYTIQYALERVAFENLEGGVFPIDELEAYFHMAFIDGYEEDMVNWLRLFIKLNNPVVVNWAYQARYYCLIFRLNEKLTSMGLEGV